MAREEARPTEYKSFPSISLKVDEEQGIVEHIITIFGVLDYGNDISHPGCFAKTIAERSRKVQVLDMHKTDSIRRILGKPLALREIGRDELPAKVLQEYPDATGGLRATTQFFINTPEGQGAFVRAKEDAIEWSYGYDALDTDESEVKRNGETVQARNLRTVRLWEYGPVIFGMCPGTTTLSAKSDPTSTESKPAPEVTENTIRIRVRSPDAFEEDSFRTINIGAEDNGIQATVGKLTGKTTMTIQSYVFAKDKFTVEEAQAWVDEHKKDGMPDIEEKATPGKADWPLASRDRAWDATAAEGRVRSWAGAEEKPNAKYASCFFWNDAENAGNFTAYKLLFCDIVGGQVQAIPRGIFAVAGVLSGARGGADIPEVDQARIRSRVAGYYARMRTEFDDDGIVPPWEKSAEPVLQAKATNLSEQVESVRAAFSNQYNPKEGPSRYWANTVYDEYVGEYAFVPKTEKAKAMKDTLLEFLNEANKVLNPEQKVGRVLAARNAQRIGAAVASLLQVMEDAGIDVPGFGKEPPAEEEEEEPDMELGKSLRLQLDILGAELDMMELE